MQSVQSCDVRNAPERRTCSISEAGRVLGLGKSAAYLAADRGEIRTLKFGARRVVPLAWLDSVLSGEARP